MKRTKKQRWSVVVFLFAFMTLPVYAQGDELQDCLDSCEYFHDLCLEAADDIYDNLNALCDRVYPGGVPNNLKCRKDAAKIYKWMRLVCNTRRDACKRRCYNE